MNGHQHFYHTSTEGSGGPARVLGTGLKIVLGLSLAAALALLIWNAKSPESLARLHGRFFGRPLEIAGLDLAYGGRAIRLGPGESLEISPAVPLQVTGFASNRWRDYDLRLRSRDLDLARLVGAPAALEDLLGEEFFLEPRTVRLEILDGPLPAAAFALEAAFTAGDWAARGAAAVEADSKIGYYRRALALAPDSAQIKAALMDSLSGAGRLRELAELLEAEAAAAGASAGAGEILARLLALYRESGDRLQEARTLERLLPWLEANGQPAGPAKSALAALYRAERPADAAKFYEELLEGSEPEHQKAFLVELAAIYREMGDPGRESGAWERLLDLAPPEELPAVWSRLVALREGDVQGGDLLEAWAGLAESLPDGPDKANAYKRLGQLRFASGDGAGAEAAFGEAARLDGADPALRLNLARLAAARGDREAYRLNLEKALALQPSLELTAELAMACEADGLAERAAGLWLALAESADSDPASSAIRQNARIRLLNLLRPEKGFDERFERRLYQFSDNAVEFYNLGVARFQAGSWEEAKKAFERALELDPGGALTADVRGYLLAVARASGRTGDLVTQAMLLYQGDPSRKEYRDLVLDQFETSKDWPGLVEAAGQWTRWAQNDPDNWRFLALGQKNAGLEAAAARSLLRAAEIESGRPASWLAAAEALERAGEAADAKGAYERVLELEPANERAESALLRLALEGIARSRGGGGPSGGG